MNKALKRNKKSWKQSRYYQQWLVRHFIKRSMCAGIIAKGLMQNNHIAMSGSGPATSALIAINYIETLQAAAEVMKK